MTEKDPNQHKIIEPTIGRRVLYWPTDYDRGLMVSQPDSVIQANGLQPCDAGVAFVHGPRMVNLSVTDHNGNVHKRTSVTLKQPGDPIDPERGGYATWMPYQVKQAEKEAKETPASMSIADLLSALKEQGAVFGTLSVQAIERQEAQTGCIGWAVEALKNGHRVQRQGWNGKGMFLAYCHGGRFDLFAVAPSCPSLAEWMDSESGPADKEISSLPYIAMKTATGEVVPWLASQTDLLAEDWILA